MNIYLHFGCFLLFTCTLAGNYEEYKRFLQEQSKNETFVKLFELHAKKFQGENYKKLEFPCVAKKKLKNATNVHELTPYDVKVIGAIGDSITIKMPTIANEKISFEAGTGITAKTILGLLIADRGISWSVGGDGTVNEHITLANMIKVYNPDLIGFSVGFGSYKWKNSHLNLAIPGDEARHMPYQARLLVDRLKSGKEGVDIGNDWKVITVFIGGNDLCGYCDDRELYSVQNYIGYIKEALDIFHAEVPKAFINVLEVINIGNVPLLNKGLICNAIHFFGCRCGAFPGKNKDELQEYVLAYQKAVRDLVNSGRYDTRDDFTVVTQPFFSETQIPTHLSVTNELILSSTNQKGKKCDAEYEVINMSITYLFGAQIFQQIICITMGTNFVPPLADLLLCYQIQHAETKDFQEDGSVDLSYFSPDCFHLSERGQESAAYALWDNMIEPVGQKRKSWSPGVPVECPSDEAPYFFTNKNSPPAQSLGDDYVDDLTPMKTDNKKSNKLSGTSPAESLGDDYFDDLTQRKTDNTSNKKSNKLSGTSVAAVLVGVICIVAVIFGYVYYVKRKHHHVEKVRILKERSLYTRI